MTSWEMFKLTCKLNWQMVQAVFQRHDELRMDLLGNPRSGRWSAVRKAHLANEPGCQVCGDKDCPDVHHILPFHLYPELELCPDNLMTLCRPHHLLVGHGMNWSCFIPDSRELAGLLRNKIKNRWYPGRQVLTHNIGEG